MNARDWLSFGASVLLVSGALGLAMCLLHAPALRTRASAHVDRLEQDLRVLQARATGRELTRAQLLACAGLLALALACTSPWPLLPVAIVVLAPGAVLQRARRRRSARIEQQLDGFLLSLSNALKAGPSLGDALATSAASAAAAV